MPFDFSSILNGYLKDAKKKYDTARLKGDIEEAKKFALLCAKTEKQLADKIPDQRKAHLENAKKWEEISDTAGIKPRKSVIEKGDRGTSDDDLSDFGETLIEKSSVTWKDIGGLKETKNLINETIIIAVANKPESIKPDKGILLFGPPGTGKTLLAAATAGSLKSTFFNVKVSSILSKYFGESSKLISALYDSARKHSPSIVFIDEFDSITMSRDGDQGEASRKVLSTLLSELDGFQDKKSDKLILTLAATNTPWDLDDAVLSRFPKRIYIPLPDNESCIEIIKIQLAGLDPKKLDLKHIGEQCLSHHYSGRDIQNMCRDAKRSMIRRSNKEIFKDLERTAELPFNELQKKRLQISPMIMEDFNQAITKIKSPISTEIIQRHEKWNKQFGAE
jgi:katanin p60 ATPase-containing subunit A1